MKKYNPNAVRFVLMREGESTWAIVTAIYIHPETDLHLHQEVLERKFFDSLTRAVTNWVKQTEEGKAAWERSSQDFNIGDLSTVNLSRKEIKKYLANEGITRLEIQIEELERSVSCATFDTVLVDEVELEEPELEDIPEE